MASTVSEMAMLDGPIEERKETKPRKTRQEVLSKELESATSRDQVMGALVDWLKERFEVGVVFIHRENELVGCTGFGSERVQDSVKTIKMSPKRDPVLSRVLETGIYHLGALKGSELVYSDVQIGPSVDGFVPPHAFFDCAADMWMIGAFDPIEGTDTVGVFNNGCDGTTPCPGDIDGNGMVDGADLTILLGNWGGSGDGDLDGSGTVDGADLTILLGGWGACP